MLAIADRRRGRSRRSTCFVTDTMMDAAAEDSYFGVKLFAAMFVIVATFGHRWIAVCAAA
jgi:hypothetical protein